MKNPKFEILIFDGFDDMDAFGVLEALHWASYSVEFKSLRQQDFVTTSAGVKIIPAGTYDPNDAPDVLIVPGGYWLLGGADREKPIGAEAEVKRGQILDVLKQFHNGAKQNNGILAGVCTGSLVIGKTGLLKGRHATTNRQAHNILKEMDVKVVDVRVVDEGEIITASGITASLDLGLWLVHRYGGPEKAIELSQQLEFEMRGPIWQHSSSDKLVATH